MVSLRFVGTFYAILGTPYTMKKFGQIVSLPEDLAKEKILDGAPLLPPDKFDALGFTEDELRTWWNTERQHAAPAPFHEKKAAAFKALAEYRESLKNPQQPEEPVHAEHE